MPLNHTGAELHWYDTIKKKDIMAYNPKWVKLTVDADFVVGPMVREHFWAKVLSIGNRKTPLKCSVDNDLEYTSEHGLARGNLLEVRAPFVMEMRR